MLQNNFKSALGCHLDWEKVIGDVIWRSGVHSYRVQIDLNSIASTNTWKVVVGVTGAPTM
jgi:hypothetical protein